MVDVLVVGTAVDILERVKSLLEAQDLTVRRAKVTADSGVAALVSLVEEVRPELVVLDLDQFEEPTLEFLRQIFVGEVRPTVLLLAVLGQESLVVSVNRIRGNVPVDFQLKPFPDDFFVRRVKSLLA